MDIFCQCVRVFAEVFAVDAILELVPDDGGLLAHHKVLPRVFYKIEALKGHVKLSHNLCFFYLKFAQFCQIWLGVLNIVHVCFMFNILFLPLS